MASARALLFATLAAATTLPYNPTTILTWPNSTTVDILDSTKIITLDLNDLSKNTTTSLPFSGAARSVLQNNTDIVVVTGDCSRQESQLWHRGTSWTQGTFGGSVQWLSQGFIQDSIYVFGGMCPSGNDSWTADASYSSSMTRLSQSTNGYAATSVGSAGPVAEAGFTITNMISGRTSQHVLVGGHTQTAFINTSQAAIFTLPQETWTFVPLQQPQGSAIEPRSGHTAVLSQDGSKIIVYGGWVGDVSTPAKPQLAVLNVGSSYSQWQWSVPSGTSSSVFGHGAAILPGDVMMVYGGFSDNMTPLTQLRYYNISSNSWTSDYSLPNRPSSAGSDNSTKIGLAVGLTVGLLILLGLVLFFVWYTRRNKRQQSALERNLLSRSSDGSYTHISQPFLEKNSIDGRGGDFAALSHFMAGQESDKEEHSNTTGMFVDNPSPTRGLRKGVPARNYQYHAAPRSEERKSRRSDIHPIEELDEDSTRLSKDEQLSEAERQLREVEAILNSTAPKRKLSNALGSYPILTSSKMVRPRSPNWTAEPVSGRVSPSKTDDRTSSSLSERSHRSVFSDGSITRTMSTRTGALLAAAAAAHVRGKAIEAETTEESRSNTMSTTGRTSPVSRKTVARSSTNGSSRADSRMAGYAESFRTARSNATYDGDGLLASSRDDPYRRALAANDLSNGRRRQGILGSLRKAIGAISSPIQRSGADYDQLHSTNSSPIKERHNPIDAPRRTVSDGGALLRQKRGRQDWQDAWPPYRDDPDPGDWGERVRTSTEKQQAEEDWDVEDAAAKRDVQIMFTIPKSRLRVVNADMDRASLRSVSDGALSRAGSLRVLKREESKITLMSSMPEAEGDDKDKAM